MTASPQRQACPQRGRTLTCSFPRPTLTRENEPSFGGSVASQVDDDRVLRPSRMSWTNGRPEKSEYLVCHYRAPYH
jgi:hypothetical protein